MREDWKRYLSLWFLCVTVMLLTACSAGGIEKIETMLGADIQQDEEIYVKPDYPNAAPGGDMEQRPDPTADWRDHIFAAEEIIWEEEVTLDLVHAVRLLCDRIYVVGTDLGEEDLYCLVSMDKTGADFQTMPLTLETGSTQEQTAETTRFQIIDLVSDGTNLYMGVLKQYQSRQEGDDLLCGEIYTLIAFDPYGTELWRREVDHRQETAEKSSSVVGPMLGLAEGAGCTIVGEFGSDYYFFDSTGEKINEFSMRGIIAEQIFADPSGDLYLQYRQCGEADSKYGMLSRQDHKVSRDITVPEALHQDAYICSHVYGGSFDLYARDDNAIYGLYIGETGMWEILDFIDSDIDFTKVNHLLILSDREMIVGGYQDADGVRQF